MIYALGVIVALAAVALAIGAITGRVKASTCCTVADASNDIRLKGDPGRANAPEGSA